MEILEIIEFNSVPEAAVKSLTESINRNTPIGMEVQILTYNVTFVDDGGEKLYMASALVKYGTPMVYHLKAYQFDRPLLLAKWRIIVLP